MSIAEPTISIMGDDDHEDFLAVFNVAWPFYATTAEEFRQELEQQTPDRRRHFVVRCGGRPMGFAASSRSVWVPDSTAADAMIYLAPEHRRRGLGAQLYQLASDFAREQQLDGLRISTFEDEPDGLAWLDSHDFVEVERLVYVALDLDETCATVLPEAQLPYSLRIVSLADRPDLKPAYHSVLVEAVPDVPGDEQAAMLDFDTWLQTLDHSTTYRHDSCFLVLNANEQALAVGELEFQALRPDIAWHGFTAVRAAARRQGIARALKRYTILHARDTLDLRQLVTENEARNVGMRAINREFGYEPVPAGLIYRGPLAVPPAERLS